MRIHILAAGLTALVACDGSPDRDDFADDFAEVWCDRQRECALGEFEEKYGDDFEACYDEKFDDPDIPHSKDPACNVDAEAADDCLDWMRSASCADWDKDNVESACEQVLVEC